MATKTTNYNLTKPSYSEDADISVINSNMDIIDSKMKEIEDKAGTGGGGSSVSWNQIQTTGSKIAEVTIDGTTTEVYAPSESGGGGGSDSSVELTQAEYDALPDTKLTDNKNYFIKDGKGGSGGASGGMNIVKMNDTPITLTTTKTEMDLSDAKFIIIEIIHNFGFTCNCVVLPKSTRCIVDFFNYYSNAMNFLEIKTEDDGISLFNPTNVGKITQNIYKVC